VALAQVAAPQQPHQDLSASNGEVFIDAVETHRGGEASRQLDLWLKTKDPVPPGGKVGLFVHETPRDGEENIIKEGGYYVPAEPFFGADDYFQVSLVLSSDFGVIDYVGSPNLERPDQNVTYWANAAGGGDFTFDGALADRVEAAAGAHGPAPTINRDHALTTADSFTELNPGRFR
jgi:hypothetical protein